jgi:multidrug efflux pump subunit AcrA (membrane-fusion protein)
MHHRPSLLLLLVCTALLVPARAQGQPRSVTVSRPLVRETAEYDFAGRLEPADAVEVRSPRSGVIGKVDCKIGGKVKKGDLLIEFDPATFEASVRSAEQYSQRMEVELEKRQAAIREAAKLISGSSPKELTKQYGDELQKLATPLDKTLDVTLDALKAGLPEAVRVEVQDLRGTLGTALRLIKARNGPVFDAAIEEQLTRLEQSAVRMLKLGGAWSKEGAGKKLTGELEELRKTLDRLHILSRVRSKEGLEVLGTEAELAEAELNRARADVRQARLERQALRVVAPADGTVLRIGVKVGEHVVAGSRSAPVLCTIAETGVVHVAFDMDVQTVEHLRELRREGKIQAEKLSDVPVYVGLAEEKGFPLLGSLESVEDQPDPKSKHVLVHAALPNPKDTLTPLLLSEDAKKKKVRLRLKLGPPRKTLLLPATAVWSDDEGKQHVLIVNDRNRVEDRTVRTGALLSGYQTIAEGLRPTDWVIVAAGRPKYDPEDRTLSPEDFAADVRLQGLKPDTLVAPVRLALPEPGTKPFTTPSPDRPGK